MISWDKKLISLEVEYWRTLKTSTSDLRLRKEYGAFELGRAFSGLTKNQQRDFDFYLSHARKEKCYPNHFCSPSRLRYKPQSVEEWYVLWDTHGYNGDNELTPPNVQDCEGIKQAKAFVNLTIEMWVTSCLHPLEGAWNFDFEEAEAAYPMAWVYDSFKNQLKKEWLKKEGYLSTFIKNKLKL